MKTVYKVEVHSYDKRWELNDVRVLTLKSKKRDNNKVRLAVIKKADSYMTKTYPEYRASVAQTLAIERKEGVDASDEYVANSANSYV